MVMGLLKLPNNRFQRTVRCSAWIAYAGAKAKLISAGA